MKVERSYFDCCFWGQCCLLRPDDAPLESDDFWVRPTCTCVDNESSYFSSTTHPLPLHIHQYRLSWARCEWEVVGVPWYNDNGIQCCKTRHSSVRANPNPTGAQLKHQTHLWPTVVEFYCCHSTGFYSRTSGCILLQLAWLCNNIFVIETW